jgi:iron-sulfur cluster assembly protein
MGNYQGPGREPDVAITLTTAARQHVGAWLAGQPPGTAFRLGLRRTGCAGFAFVVGWADVPADGDVRFDVDGLPVVIDRDSLPLVDGTEVDYVRQGLNAAFRFRNPRARGECGCGESFTA